MSPKCLLRNDRLRWNDPGEVVDTQTWELLALKYQVDKNVKIVLSWPQTTKPKTAGKLNITW